MKKLMTIFKATLFVFTLASDKKMMIQKKNNSF